MDSPTGRGKPGLVGAALFTAAGFLLPFLRVRPNRILTGEAYRLLELGGAGPLILGLAAALALLYTLLPARLPRLRGLCGVLAGGGALLALPISAGLLAFLGETVRISLGTGFFLMLAGALLMVTDASLGAALSKRLWWLLALMALGLIMAGQLGRLSLVKEYHARQDAFWAQTIRHLVLAATAALAALVLGLPLSFAMLDKKLLERPILMLVNIGQTIPTLSLLGLLMVPLSWLGQRSALLKSWGISGVGFWPAWIALFIYCLFPILVSSLAGLRMVDAGVMEAASAMGMTRRQAFFRVRLPLAGSLILAGARTALIQAMGNATLAALIGGGGLGNFIFLGLAQSAPDLILLGALPLVSLTFMMNALFGLMIEAARRERRDDQDPIPG